MVVISAPPALSSENLQAYRTSDPLLSNAPFLVLYGRSSVVTSANSTFSARIQSHVFTPAGFQSYTRLAVSPATPLYAAVSCLPKEEQGDEVVRALAYSIFKYFGELPETAKDQWIALGHRQTGGDTRRLFTAQHAADIASRMLPMDNTHEVVQALETAFSVQSVPYLDLDVVLAPGSIHDASTDEAFPGIGGSDDEELVIRYGQYAPVIKLFGDTIFMPTSKMQRAPSRPTTLNRSLTFAKKQKENIRRELNEFVDTEERYVKKLEDLVCEVAAGFREQARSYSPLSASPDLKALEALFPPSLDAILKLNTGFLDAIRRIQEITEDGAIADIEATPDSSTARHQLDDSGIDVTGSTTFALALLDWYPKFAEAYSQYIHVQPNFTRLLKSCTADSASTFTKQVNEVGEQRLMSLLIEPVQRLPRYSLYLDNIAKQLPIRHPALKLFLNAKDLVAQICDRQSADFGSARASARITSIISSWPSTFRPHGRFVTALDVIEAGPLNVVEKHRKNSSEMLLLLFAGHVVFARKLGANSMSSRTFMAEVDKPGPYLRSETGDPGLLFIVAKPLCDINFSETMDGSCIRLFPARAPVPKAIVTPTDDRIQQFRLTGGNEGRAGKFLLDVAKARIEGRVPEAERQGLKWEARLTADGRYDLGLCSSIFEDGIDDTKHDQRRPGAIRLVLDPERGAKKLVPGEAGADIVASVSVQGQGFYRLDIEAFNERNTRDMVTEAEFLPVLIKRLGNLVQMRTQIRHPVATIYLLQHHGEILNSLPAPAPPLQRSDTASRRSKRTASPVKMLSSLFGNASLKELDPTPPAAFSLGQTPRLAPHNRTQSVPVVPVRTNENRSPSRAAQASSKVGVASTNSFEALEQTLSCFTLALQARKGNVVGSVVARRAFADEATVNQLYNALIENPTDLERASQAPVDVLFAAFEQFLQNAWKDRMGSVIKTEMLEDLQARMERLGALEYEEYEEMRFAELGPQNRRALSAIVTTLAELLHGTRNDGDRGALTAAFAEMLVSDADPHDFIPLFDRFVENEEALAAPDQSAHLSVPGSISSSTHYGMNGSVNSKASSLSRRLGFGSLRRENSKKDIGSILRMGSKKALPPDPPSEASSRSRAQSQDLTSQVNALRRNGARDGTGSRPGTARSEQEVSAPPSIEVTPAKQSGKARSRRSSLSDLTALDTFSASPFWTESASKKVNGIFEAPSVTHSPTKFLSSGTPIKSASVRYQSPAKENASPMSRWNSTREPSPSKLSGHTQVPQSLAQAFGASSAATGMSAQPGVPSSIPRGPLSERMASGNTPPVSANASPSKHAEAVSPKKTAVQSPTKIRERLQHNHGAITGAQSAMQAEMEKIGLELAELSGGSSSPDKSNQSAVANLNTRLKALEGRVAHFSKNLTEHAMTLEKDLNASLQAAHKKAKAFDGELQKAHLENDVMFARMNDEIAKVFAHVQGGDGVDEMKRMLKEAQSEALKWKKEAMSLKRENTTLRSLV